MLKLTNAHTHRDVYINPSHIVTIATHTQFNGGIATTITLDNSSKPVLDVIETPDQIVAMMGGNMGGLNHSVVEQVIEDLKNAEVDGETMQHILSEVGLSDQMLRQLIMTAQPNLVFELVQEKADLISKEFNNKLMYKY